MRRLDKSLVDDSMVGGGGKDGGGKDPSAFAHHTLLIRPYIDGAAHTNFHISSKSLKSHFYLKIC